MLCEYGCGQESKYKLKNNKWCCSKTYQKCPANRKKYSNPGKRNPMYGVKGKNNPNFGRKHTKEAIEKIRKTHKGKIVSEETRKKLRNAAKNYVITDETRKKISIANKGHKTSEESKLKISIANKGNKHTNKTKKIISKKNSYTIKKYHEKYPLFSKIEEMRYNPDKPREKEIQVRCKNHNCPNSKEQDGWFTPTKIQIYERIRGIEIFGNDGSYFYCCKECKTECPLFNLRSDLFKKEKFIYNSMEYKIFRDYVLKRDNYKCQYCGKKAEHVHHERPQKLEPFFALDPDLAWSVCKECHYKYGHKDECSTGKLSSIICL